MYNDSTDSLVESKGFTEESLCLFQLRSFLLIITLKNIQKKRIVIYVLEHSRDDAPKLTSCCCTCLLLHWHDSFFYGQLSVAQQKSPLYKLSRQLNLTRRELVDCIFVPSTRHVPSENV